jgi:hypothetical protein
LSTTADPQTFLCGAHARDRFGITCYQLNRLAALGQIRIEAQPGVPIRFRAEDIEAYIAEHGVSRLRPRAPKPTEARPCTA